MGMMSVHGGSFAVGFHLHAIFGGMLVVGAVLFILWAAKLKPEELKKWLIGILAIGLIGTLLTARMGYMGTNWTKDGMMKYRNMGDMMDKDVEEIITPGELSLAE